EGVKESGINRMINRERLYEEGVDAALSDVHSLPYQVLDGFLYLLKERKKIPAFHPSSEKEVIDFIDKRLLVIERRFQDETVWVIINVSEDSLMVPDYKRKFDITSNRSFDGEVEPYGVYLLK
ncbi:MAG: hypothetical protein V3W43_03560, partial [Desulfatiglandaceae bacterium]